MAGEDAPQEPPKELMEGEQHPVTEPDTTEALGEAAVGGPTQIPVGDEGENPHPNREDDPERAHDMAIAGDELRTKAVADRNIKRNYDENMAKLDESHRGLSDLNDEKPSNRRERKEIEKRREELLAERDFHYETVMKEDGHWDINGSAERQFAKDFQHEGMYMAFPSGDPETRAKHYDERASRVEEWAGILHDHPVSEAFREAHPGVDITPESLVYLEDETTWLKLELEGLDHDGRAVSHDVKSILRGSRGTLSESSIQKIQELLPLASKERDDEWEKLTAALHESAAAIDAFKVNLAKEVRSGPLQNKLAMAKKLLDDVRRETGVPVEDNEANDDVKAEAG